MINQINIYLIQIGLIVLQVCHWFYNFLQSRVLTMYFVFFWSEYESSHITPWNRFWIICAAGFFFTFITLSFISSIFRSEMSSLRLGLFVALDSLELILSPHLPNFFIAFAKSSLYHFVSFSASIYPAILNRY